VANPSHLLIDSDVLLQVLKARQRGLLVKLKEKCGVAPAVVPEVESEVRRYKRSQFEPQFGRMVENTYLSVLEPPDLRRLLAARGMLPALVEGRLRTLEQECQDYATRVDEGEAYTHATAAALGLPVLSNDWQALQVLTSLARPVGCPTARFLDLLVFARRCDWIDDEEGEKACRILDGEREHLLPEFKHKGSFSGSWRSFPCRLSADRTKAAHAPATFKDVLFLKTT